MEDLRIAVDVDGTLVEQEPLLCERLRHDHDIPIYPEDLRVWGQDIPGTDLTWGRAIANYWQDDSFVEAVPPLDGALDTIQALYETGANLVIATHRPEEDRDVTEEWLVANDVPYDEFYCGRRWDKSEVGADVLIDDRPQNIIDAANAGQHGILVLRLFNFDALDALPESEYIHTALDITPHSPLCLATRPGIQWAAFYDIIDAIATDCDA